MNKFQSNLAHEFKTNATLSCKCTTNSDTQCVVLIGLVSAFKVALHFRDGFENVKTGSNEITDYCKIREEIS